MDINEQARKLISSQMNNYFEEMKRSLNDAIEFIEQNQKKFNEKEDTYYAYNILSTYSKIIASSPIQALAEKTGEFNIYKDKE